MFLLEKLPRQEEVILVEESKLLMTKKRIESKITKALSEKNPPDTEQIVREHEPFCACVQCYPLGMISKLI